jgi:hypothetical protein
MNADCAAMIASTSPPVSVRRIRAPRQYKLNCNLWSTMANL